MNRNNDNSITNPNSKTSVASFQEICEERYSRRDFLNISLKSGLATGISATGLAGCAEGAQQQYKSKIEQKRQLEDGMKSTFNFVEIQHGIDQGHHIAPDHNCEVLLRWGDPMFADSPEFDLDNQTVQTQLQQFGYNNDYIGYLSLPAKPSQQARALLCVNHEYPIHGLMFPDYVTRPDAEISKEHVGISQASVGASIVEIVKRDGQWQVNRSSNYNRRITALETKMKLTGPVAGHPRLRTSIDQSGENVIGMVNNCAGGMTPWGTFLSCEENFNYHFSGTLPKNHPETINHQRYNVPVNYFQWGKHDQRFDLAQEPNEPNRFGWVVEIDPLDPTSTPKKRTALGRFKHEGGENVIAPGGQLVIYMGDDQRFEYLYKFVTRDKVDLQNRNANQDLLDTGTLYVAKFHAQGQLDWLPLNLENRLLQAHYGSLAEILLEPRRAADMLGATPMDRPEDVVPNTQTGKVYVMLTNNTKRKEVNSANSRRKNKFGHIIEITEMDNDFAATRADWDTVVKCGDPKKSKHKASWNDNTSQNGWFASPDNGAIDSSGRLWVATDQGTKSKLSGTSDGLWGLETQGSLRGTGRMFFRVPKGAEMCGPKFSDDGESLFLCVQHPGMADKNVPTNIKTASTRWPDFEDGKPPKPSVVVVTRKGGGIVG